MEWALGNQINIRTLAVGCAVAVVCATALTVRPKAIPLHVSLPSISLGATAVDTSVVTITQLDAQNASAVVTSMDDVHTQQDVVSYADSLMQKDPRILEIQVGDTSVSMTYQTQNRILNVRTVSSETKATVHENGTVAIAGSWIRPLFTHVAQASSPDIGFSDITIGNKNGGITPRTEARILTRLHGRFQIGAIR